MSNVCSVNYKIIQSNTTLRLAWRWLCIRAETCS